MRTSDIFVKIQTFGELGFGLICVDLTWVGVFHALDHQRRVEMV